MKTFSRKNVVAGIPSIASMHPEARSPHKTYQDHQTHHMVGFDCNKIFKRAYISGSHYPSARPNYQ